MIEFVDTHTHLFTTEFDIDRADAVRRAVEAGVGALCLPAINEESLPSLMSMCDEFPAVCHPMIGPRLKQRKSGVCPLSQREIRVQDGELRFHS